MEKLVEGTLQIIAAEAASALRQHNAMQIEYDAAHTQLCERIAALNAECGAAWAVENEALLQRKEDADHWWHRAEQALRQALVSEYVATGVKSFLSNAGTVAVNHKYLIADTAKALDWCRVNAPTLVMLGVDEKRLLKGVRDGIFTLGPDIVNESVETTTRLREDVLAKL